MNPKLANFIKAVNTFDRVIRQVREDAWDNDSPCEGWTARDVVAHQCAVLEALASIARTGEWTRPERREPPEEPRGSLGADQGGGVGSPGPARRDGA